MVLADKENPDEGMGYNSVKLRKRPVTSETAEKSHFRALTPHDRAGKRLESRSSPVNDRGNVWEVAQAL